MRLSGWWVLLSIPAAAILLFILLVRSASLHSMQVLHPRVIGDQTIQEGRVKPPQFTREFSVPVLMYHHIGESPTGASAALKDLTVTTDALEAQMRYLSQNGYTFLPLDMIVDALLRHRPLPVRSVAVTIDDGYEDTYLSAFPVLREYRVPATVFVVTGVVGAKDHLTWQQIQIMREGGIEFQSHTVTHPDLRTISGDRLLKELKVSAYSLRFRGISATMLAYPAGEFDADTVHAAASAGYRAAWMKSGGPVHPWDSPYTLPRVRVHGSTSLSKFRLLVVSGSSGPGL